VASGRPIEDFDLVMISNSFALEELNIITLFRRNGIPETALKRCDDVTRDWPFFILGGSNAGACQAILERPGGEKGDALVEGIFIGEADNEITTLLKAFEEAYAKKENRMGEARASIMAALSAASGGFFSALMPRVATQARIYPENFEEASLLVADYPLLNTDEADTVRLTISRGCPSFCVFCMESWHRKPYREIPLGTLLESARRAKAATGASSIEICSFNFNAYSSLVPLVLELNKLFAKVSMMSQRADILASVPGLLDFELAAGTTAFTLGVEGISQRMRDYFRKELDTAPLKSIIKRLLATKARKIKLFYIISGFERGADIEEFKGFLRFIAEILEQGGNRPRIIVSAGYLVRMPGTPLAAETAALGREGLEKIASLMESACEEAGIEFRLASFYDEYRLTQILVGHRHDSYGLLRALADQGIEYVTAIPKGSLKAVERFFALDSATDDESPPDPLRAPGYYRPSVEEAFIGGFPDVGADSCLGARCLACGACRKEGSEKQAILSHTLPVAEGRSTDRLRELIQFKNRIEALYVLMSVPFELDGATPAFLASWALKKIITIAPEQFENCLSARRLEFSTEAGQFAYPNFFGKAIFSLKAWDRAFLEKGLMGRDDIEIISSDMVARGKPRIDFLRLRVFVPAGFISRLSDSFQAYLASVVVPCTVRKSAGNISLDIHKQGKEKHILAEANFFSASMGGQDVSGFSVKAFAKFDFSALTSLYAARNGPSIQKPALMVEGISFSK
jgi:radical SAM superfamily enzyme YgiQ (UPF0313 family)